MSAYSAAVLADSPIRYYRLSDTTGQAADATGNGHNGGYYSSGVTYSAVGPFAGSTGVTLDGSVGRITLPTDFMPTGNSSWTLEGWCYVTTTAGQYIVQFGTSASGQAVGLYVTNG